MDAYQSAAQHLAALPRTGERPIVVFVGPSCRTWFTDLHRLRALIWDLYDIQPFDVAHGGKFPFDMYVEQYCAEFGISSYLVGPSDRSVRLSAQYSRDPELALGSALVVAFPTEDGSKEGKAKAEYPPESADLDVVRNAITNGVPVLAIYRSGRATWNRGGTTT